MKINEGAGQAAKRILPVIAQEGRAVALVTHHSPVSAGLENRLGPLQIGLADEDVQVAVDTKRRVAIYILRQHRPLERHDRNAGSREGLRNAKQFRNQKQVADDRVTITLLQFNTNRARNLAPAGRL